MNPTIPDWQTLLLVSPELALTAGVVVVLITGILRQNTARNLLILAGLLAAASSALAIFTTHRLPEDGQVFSGMLTVDPFSQYFKAILGLFLLLVIYQWSVLTDREQMEQSGPDFLALIFGAAVGMALMASSSNLLMVFLATETASFPSYALAGFHKRRTGSEAAVKYVMFGAVSSAITVFGMSLLYMSSGTLDLAGALQSASHGGSPLAILGVTLAGAGVLFKIAAVPAHFWCPDVFQAAPTPVTTLLSVASKAAGLCVLVRCATLASAPGVPSDGLVGAAWALVIIGVVSATVGNLLATRQVNLKRLISYSSIAQAGYMVSAVGAILVADPGVSRKITGAVLFYITAYMFMNMAVLTAAGLIARQTGSYDIRRYYGLHRKSPLLFVGLLIGLLSLFGMPVLGGFMAKLYLLSSVVRSTQGALPVVVVAAVLINSLISFYFYIRPIYFAVLADRSESRPEPDTDAPQAWHISVPAAALLLICSLMTVLLGTAPGIAMSSAQDMSAISYKWHGRTITPHDRTAPADEAASPAPGQPARF